MLFELFIHNQVFFRSLFSDFESQQVPQPFRALCGMVGTQWKSTRQLSDSLSPCLWAAQRQHLSPSRFGWTV